MEENFNRALDWAKSLDNIEGCITGSSLLGYIEGANQDIDIFVYNEASLNEVLYCMQYNPMFQILDPLEQWKFDKWKKEQRIPYKQQLVTVKFKYNLCIDINVILKKDKKTAFDVISSFDFDIITKAFDLQTKKTLDLSEGDGKVVHWNKWNKSFYSGDIWTINRLLRQFIRCVKYHKRGYNTDGVTNKYIELIDELIKYNNIFNSANFDAKVSEIKHNAKVLKKILQQWLTTHHLTEEEMVNLNEKLKEL